MAKLLWIGDAGTTTGFSHVSQQIGERLVAMGHEVHALAIGYQAKDPYEGPLKLYRAEAGPTHNYLGYDRTAELVKRLEPDLVITNEDAPMTLKRLLENPADKDKVLLKSQPIISYLPVDGTGIPETWQQLTKLVTVLPYTRFAAEQMGLDYWAHHGIDPIFRPDPALRAEWREKLGIDDDTFAIGRIDTNSGRKDWGSTWKVIDHALTHGLDETKTIAVFHTKLRNPGSGVDLRALISRGHGKYLVTNEDDWPVEDIVGLHNAFDAYITTTRGEGWGLGGAQSLACGVPVLATAHSSLPEVLGPGAVFSDPVATMTNPYGVELALTNVVQMSNNLRWLASYPDRRRRLGEKGREHVSQFTWDNTANTFSDLIEGLLAQT